MEHFVYTKPQTTQKTHKHEKQTIEIDIEYNEYKHNNEDNKNEYKYREYDYPLLFLPPLTACREEYEKNDQDTQDTLPWF